MFLKLNKLCLPVVRSLKNNNKLFFAKEAPPKKEGGKKDDKAAAAPVVVQPTLNELVQQWLIPTHQSLSPSELKYYNEGFQDLSESDKEVLNELAEKFVEQHTAVFYDAVLKKGALGTTELYYTSVQSLPEAQIPQFVKGLRKTL